MRRASGLLRRTSSAQEMFPKPVVDIEHNENVAFHNELVENLQGLENASYLATLSMSTVEKSSSELYLRKSRVTDRNVDAILKSLEQFPVLTRLDLRDNNITETGAQMITTFLENQIKHATVVWQLHRKKCVCVESIKLGGNGISHQTLQHIDHLLGKCQNINLELGCAYVFAQCTEVDTLQEDQAPILGSFSKLQVALTLLFKKTQKAKQVIRILELHDLVDPKSFNDAEGNTGTRRRSSSVGSNRSNSSSSGEDFPLSIDFSQFVYIVFAILGQESSDGLPISPRSMERHLPFPGMRTVGNLDHFKNSNQEEEEDEDDDSLEDDESWDERAATSTTNKIKADDFESDGSMESELESSEEEEDSCEESASSEEEGDSEEVESAEEDSEEEESEEDSDGEEEYSGESGEETEDGQVTQPFHQGDIDEEENLKTYLEESTDQTCVADTSVSTGVVETQEINQLAVTESVESPLQEEYKLDESDIFDPEKRSYLDKADDDCEDGEWFNGSEEKQLVTDLDISEKDLTDLEESMSAPGLDETLERLDARHNKLGIQVRFPAQHTFSQLHTINLSHNSLTRLDKFLTPESVPGLKHLDVSCNEIVTVKGLDMLDSLVTINARSNSIRDVSYLAGLLSLSTLDLSENKIASATCLRGLSLNTSMEKLWLQGNPVAKVTRYRAQMIHLLPSLSELDDKPFPPSSTRAKALKSRIPKPQASPAAKGKKKEPMSKVRLGQLSRHRSPKLKNSYLAQPSSLPSPKKVVMEKEKVEALCTRLANARPKQKVRGKVTKQYKSGFGSSVPKETHLAMKSRQRKKQADAGGTPERRLSKSLLAPTAASTYKSVNATKADDTPGRVHSRAAKSKQAKDGVSNKSHARKAKDGASNKSQPLTPPTKLRTPGSTPILNSSKKSAIPVTPPQHPITPAKNGNGTLNHAEKFVLEARLADWCADAEQQKAAAQTALGVLRRITASKSFSQEQLADYKERLVDVGLWQRIDSPPIQPNADGNTKVLTLQRQVEMSKAAVRNFVQLLETEEPDSEHVESYREYIIQTGLCPPNETADMHLLDKRSVVSTSSVCSRASIASENTKATENTLIVSDEAKGTETTSAGLTNTIDDDGASSQKKATKLSKINFFKLGGDATDGVSLPEELMRQREGTSGFYYDNESVASSVWSIEGQASVKPPPEADNSVQRSNNEIETSLAASLVKEEQEGENEDDSQVVSMGNHDSESATSPRFSDSRSFAGGSTVASSSPKTQGMETAFFPPSNVHATPPNPPEQPKEEEDSSSDELEVETGKSEDDKSIETSTVEEPLNLDQRINERLSKSTAAQDRTALDEEDEDDDNLSDYSGLSDLSDEISLPGT